MKRFLVLYMTAAAQLEEWMKTPEAERKDMENKMKTDWDTWMASHSSMIKETAGAGKTKRVTATGVEDVKNDVMLYSIVEAESQDAVTEAFKDHPHFGIPNAWIDVMPANVLPGMGS